MLASRQRGAARPRRTLPLPDQPCPTVLAGASALRSGVFRRISGSCIRGSIILFRPLRGFYGVS
ncbi:hypothetical protein YM304_34600 [Ilumatobacter coccineus YM16-304]|uniref:Uncharacterized protein n=1 Tax=Ilumatobacter coccineus (strain NBRC 103263 / KCTC 29153 / YM16-304) TaxID=1313172 RepID=A0A6C7E7Y8_ILUCY|nr:hypothetical protein YM304_34600 [Ilumatobacter coccineus YM16-304]